MTRRYAVISIGTNSTRVLLADVGPETPRTEVARSIGTRIGEGLGESGRLGDEPMARTLDVLRGYMTVIRGHYVKLTVIATSALRRAENGDEFAANVSEITGAPLRILSGDEEAVASYRGALTVLDASNDERAGVVDMGGGSTEFAAGVSLQPDQQVSCEIGAVRLTEAVPALAGNDNPIDRAEVERARALAAAALKPIADFCDPQGGKNVDRLALVGGTATTVASIMRGKHGAVQAAQITRDDLTGLLDRLLSLSLPERKEIAGMRAQRADIVPGGIIVLLAAMEATRRESAVATSADLLLGIALQERDALAGRARHHEGLRTPRAH